jgi:hypothetical protein
VPEFAEQPQRLALGRGGGRVVADRELYGAEIGEGAGLSVSVAKGSVKLQGLGLAGGGCSVITGLVLGEPKVVEGDRLSALVAEIPVQLQGTR